MMFKIKHNLAPNDLKNLIPIPHINNYNLRNRQELQNPFCRLQLFKRSFIPSGIRQWNILAPEIKILPSVDTFKQHIRTKSRTLLFYYGKRWPSIHHTRMRIGCSKLNYDLCSNLHVINNMSCQCGSPIENASHFFFACPLFTIQRQKLMQSLPIMPDLSCEDLLSGITHLTLDQNLIIFKAVQDFIVETKRFV